MKIICDSCQTKYSIADEKVRGKVFKIKCKKCSHIIVVRGTAADEASAAPQVDEKETKVFDYSGYDSPRDAAAAMAAGGGGGDEAVWHLVIDSEQIGPLTRAEVIDRYDAGQIDTESYIWREGFGDWQRLASVEDFAALAQASGRGVAASAGAAAVAGLGNDGHPAPDDSVAGMFGGPAFDDGGAAQSDPADLFAAAAGNTVGMGSDLFGGGDDMHAGGDDGGGGGGLFGGMEAGGGGGMGASAQPAVDQQLTGQRNENSVLFSLSNLASLASDAPKAAPVSSPSSQPGMAQAGGQEGSGLIDIRSMAQVYLGDKQSDMAMPGAPAAPDDLPVFSSGGFDGGAQVLLPMGQPASNNKVLYALVGLIGALAIIAVVLTIVILRGGDDKGDNQVAANTGQTDGADRGSVKPPDGTGDDGKTAAGGTEGADGADDGKTVAGGTDGVGADDGKDDDGKDDDGKDDSASNSTKSSSKSTKSTSKSTKSSAKSRRSSSRGSKPSSKSSSDDSGSKSSGSKEKCDEVACLVDPSLPCCKGSKKSSGGSSKSSGGGADSNLPERPGRSDISSGVGKVRGRVQSCGDKHGYKGTVTVKIGIAGSGKVSGASANKGSSAFQSCVVSAVKKARFSKSQKGISVNYPFVFR